MLIDAGQRAVLLPAEDGEPSRGPAVERRLRRRAGRARHPARHGPGDRPDRDLSRRRSRWRRSCTSCASTPPGLNAGRWDYLFSMIKKFRTRGADFLLPDRNSVTMTAPFMRAYTELLVRTCHQRGAHAIGGMAAFIPNRRDAEVNETAMAKVRDGQDPRGRRRLRRLLGRAPGPGAGRAARSSTRCSATGPTSSTACARTCTSPPSSCSTSPATPGEVTEAGPAQRRQRRHPVPRVLAARRRRGRDLQPDGGRGHRGDLPLAGLAVAAQRRRAGRRRRRSPASWSSGSSTRSWRSCGPRGRAGAGTTPRALFTEVALADDFADFLTLPAYERMPWSAAMAGLAALAARLRAELGAAKVIDDRQELRTYECDGLAHYKVVPALVVLAETTARRAPRWSAPATTPGVPFVARGSGTGLSGGALPHADGVLIVTSRMRDDPRGRPRRRSARSSSPA